MNEVTEKEREICGLNHGCLIGLTMNREYGSHDLKALKGFKHVVLALNNRDASSFSPGHGLRAGSHSAKDGTTGKAGHRCERQLIGGDRIEKRAG